MLYSISCAYLFSSLHSSLYLLISSACVFVLSCLSHVRLFVTPWTTAHQAPLSMGFSRQEYWSGLPCPPPGDLPDLGIKPVFPECPVLQEFFTAESLGKLLVLSSLPPFPPPHWYPVCSLYP